MGYLHIDNLYKNQEILLFKECYALEKIHGTSTHIKWTNNGIPEHQSELKFFSGGCNREHFISLFDENYLEKKFKELNIPNVTIFGEGYGGKQQGMRTVYGEELKFIAFDVKIDDMWLNVYDAEKFVDSFDDLEFVWYTRTSTELDALDILRDGESAQALRNGMGIHMPSTRIGEGIVLRPLIELTRNDGKRIIAKHKGAAFSEIKKTRVVNRTDAQLKVLAQVKDICADWVTENRLSNILSHDPAPLELSQIPSIIGMMIEDVLREGKGEIVESKQLKQAISRETALMVKRRVQKI